MGVASHDGEFVQGECARCVCVGVSDVCLRLCVVLAEWEWLLRFLLSRLIRLIRSSRESMCYRRETRTKRGAEMKVG